MWTSPTIVEDKGVEFGLQAHNGAPVIVDRFSRGNGYNQFTVGKIGSGKSFSTKLNMLRTYSQRRDTVIFMLDPLEGFQHIVRRLQGKHVIVGGNEAFNPMEIRPPSSDIAPEVLNKMNPLKQKIESVMGFLETYFKQQGHELGGRREVLSTAVNKAYEQANITPDPETHTNTSPTLRDVIGILKRIANDPEAAALSSSQVEVQKFEEDAAELLVGLRPFMEGREFSNLGTHTSVDLGADIVYIDLRQQEASGSPGMMMQLLFEQVYQRAKETSKNVMFAIDEAHMIIKDAESLDFLEQAIRHSRHYNLSINFITQTVDEFFQKEQAATIASQCSIKLLHKVKQMNEESARRLELSPIEVEYVKNAKTGEESPYSEALIGVGRHGYIPIQVHALEAEAMIIDYEGYLEEEREMDIEVQGEAEDLDLE
jgi:type IV secretory pathway VirB4 component